MRWYFTYELNGQKKTVHPAYDGLRDHHGMDEKEALELVRVKDIPQLAENILLHQYPVAPPAPPKKKPSLLQRIFRRGHER